jgi:nanoRNase/pAp phosphatase (c-di-AMP/oligoRNAs hydrolase)
MKENIEKLKELIEKSEKILLINHVNMDADAF